MVGALEGSDNVWWWCLTIKSLFSVIKIWKICEFSEMSDGLQNCVTDSDKTEIKDT